MTAPRCSPASPGAGRGVSPAVFSPCRAQAALQGFSCPLPEEPAGGREGAAASGSSPAPFTPPRCCEEAGTGAGCGVLPVPPPIPRQACAHPEPRTVVVVSSLQDVPVEALPPGKGLEPPSPAGSPLESPAAGAGAVTPVGEPPAPRDAPSSGAARLWGLFGRCNFSLVSLLSLLQPSPSPPRCLSARRGIFPGSSP